VPVQVGGGIRTIERACALLGLGADRVIFGTAALETPDVVEEACRRFPGRVALGIDARDGRVAVKGWLETSEVTAVDLARRFAGLGAACIIYTDIERDGTQQGVNIAATRALAEAVGIPVIASGGIGSLADIEALLPCEPSGVAMISDGACPVPATFAIASASRLRS